MGPRRRAIQTLAPHPRGLVERSLAELGGNTHRPCARTVTRRICDKTKIAGVRKHCVMASLITSR